MPIKGITDNATLPVIGKIRLGIRDKNRNFPKSVDHFVLHDAPQVAKYYGDKPKELDVFFLDDEIEEAIPHWYKLYSGGATNKKGEVVGGKLQCYGDGEIAYHMAARDPITRIVPTRPCLLDKCPDWLDKKGNQACKMSMKVRVLVPMASVFGIFEIDTNSVTSIRRFVAQVSLIKNQFGTLRGIPFKIYRDPVEMDVPGKPGVRKTHYILSIGPNEEFRDKLGEELRLKISDIVNGNYFAAAKHQIEAPMEDGYAIEHHNVDVDEATGEIIDPVEVAKAVANDPDVCALFEHLSALTGRRATEKAKMITIRKLENKDASFKTVSEAVNTLKALTIDYLQSKIVPVEGPSIEPTSTSRPADKPASSQSKPAATLESAASVNADGLI